MTSLSRRKRRTTARSRWTATGINVRRLLAGLAVGWLGVSAIMAADQPVTVIPQAPANTTVTIIYEKLPTGEIRPVSNQPVTMPSAPAGFKPAPAAPPQPTYQFKPVPMEAPRNVVNTAPSPQLRSSPIHFAPATMPGITYSPPPMPAPPVYTQPAISLNAPEPPSSVIAMPHQPRAIQPTSGVAMSYRRLPNGAILPVAATEAVPMVTDLTLVQNPPAPPVVNQPPTPTPNPMPIPTTPINNTPMPLPTQTPPPQPQSPLAGGEADYGSLSDYGIETKPPTLARLFRLESERELQTRIIKEIENRPVKPGEGREIGVKFPDYLPLTDQAFQMREFGGLIKQIEPHYVCHARLDFEDLNTERYGWEAGILQPFFSAGTFFKDCAFYPYKVGTRPLQRYDCSAGKCFPGDPVPFLIYPPELSATGAGWETFFILAGFALIP